MKTNREIGELLDGLNAIVRGRSSDDLKKIGDAIEQTLLPYQERIVKEAIEREGWSNAPLEEACYENLIFHLCMARQAKVDEPEEPSSAHQWALLGI